MINKESIADPFGIDDVCEDGLYLVGHEGKMPQPDFDLRKASEYATKHNLSEITEEVAEMFKR